MSNLEAGESLSSSRKKVKEHVNQLQRLQEKDPEFFQFLKDVDKDLLDFKDEEDTEDEAGTDVEGDVEPPHVTAEIEKVQEPPRKVITGAMVDTWCREIREGEKLGAVRHLLRAFRAACHHGDDSGTDSTEKFSIISGHVFNKIMVFVLNEMDGVLRGLLRAPTTGGKKETIMDLTTTRAWKNYASLMKLYLGNSLHILTQMTDEEMIAFTLKRVKASAVFLAAFPTLLRKYIKVALHTWGTGRGALPVISLLFLRDLCVRLGSDCLDSCLKGVYKAYVLNCKLAKSVSMSKLQQINFLGNCVVELYGVDPLSAYQHAFVFIRQLAVILRGALTERGPKSVKDKKKGKSQQERSKSTQQTVDHKAYQKVYDWQFISCLELWTGVICAYNSDADFRPLAYPLTQIIFGVASLVPTARYFPLRLRCIKMLNRIAGATGTFIPLSSLLLDMLEMKELHMPPTGGIGKAVNLLTVKQVGKSTLKTRSFQDACVCSVVEELAEHLAQWSYSVAFYELSFIPLVRLRNFCKTTKVDKFRREMKTLIRQVEANIDFTNSRRIGIEFSPNDPAAASFLQSEMEAGSSPLSQFVANLRLRARQRSDSIEGSSVVVGGEPAEFGSKLSKAGEDDDDEDNDGDGAAVFNSSWLPEKKSEIKEKKAKASRKRQREQEPDAASDYDIVEDLVLSSDDEDDDEEEEPSHDSASEEEEHGSKAKPVKHRRNKPNQGRKKQKSGSNSSKNWKGARPNKKAKKGAGN